MKLGNQWRGLGPDELKFLADKANEKRAAEKVVQDQEKRDLAEYRESVLPSDNTSWAALITQETGK